ncbi:jerky protein homolog-like [Antedon mediterranea]|uniref:jerky protein homolog-like n=1 Tax=Antedon mediterranea TaxID=105859 RepID=UPI003AF7BEA2
MAPTRKRQSVSIDTKLKIIAARRKGLSNLVVATQFGLSKSTVSTIWAKRGEIESSVSKCELPSLFLEKSYLSKAAYAKVDEASYAWMTQQRRKGVPVSGPLLKEKALLFAKELYPDSHNKFEASNGWLECFKKRHGIHSLSMQGESLSANASSIEPFQAKLKMLMDAENLTRDQIFNADETGLYWKLMPSRSLVLHGEKTAKNFKTAKDRVTVMGCANASGTCKIPLTFVHKPAKPRCFKNINMDRLPVDYYSQKNAWMDSTIFKKWFFENFVPRARCFCRENNIPEKIVLLLDNAPAHPSEEVLTTEDGAFLVMFLPPNTTSLIQPMDQGVLEPLKRRYKKNLLRHILCQIDTPIPEAVKQLTIKDAVYWIADAWESATEENLKRSWNKLLKNVEERVEQPENEADDQTAPDEVEDRNIFETMFQELGASENMMSVDEWLAEDAEDPGHQWLTDEEIVDEFGTSSVSSDEEEQEEEQGENTRRVKPEQAFEALGVVVEWFEQMQKDPCHVRQIRRWRDEAAQMRAASLNQTKITNFFE